MTRGLVPGLASPHPLGTLLPAVYADDRFAQRFTSALDDALAPIFSTLDCLPAYLDPNIAPPDFVEWLATWVGMVFDERWPLERRRRLVAVAGDLYRWRGTSRGLADAVEAVTGVRPEIIDSGSVAWSAEPGAPLPGDGSSQVIVRLRVPDPSAVDSESLNAIVTVSKPAHVRHVVEVLAA